MKNKSTNTNINCGGVYEVKFNFIPTRINLNHYNLINGYKLFLVFTMFFLNYMQSISAQTFQAENGSLFNGAVIQNCSSCSGGSQVGNLGGPSKGYFTTVVNTAIAGTYSMDFSFSSGDTRSIFMSVNNGNAIEVICNSGNWGVVGTISLGLLLNTGNNSIKFFNDNGYGPNIDKFELQLQQSPNPFGNFLSFETENGSLFNGADIQNCGSCSEGKQVGNLGGPSNGYFTTLANVSVTGTYIMNLSFSSGDPRSIFISVNNGSPVEVVCNSGNWGVVGTTNVSLNLSYGDNTIRFFNESGYGPNIDKFDLLLQQVTDPFVNRITAQAETSSLFNGASIQNCTSCSEGKQVGNIGGPTNGYYTKVVNVSSAGTYTMDLSFSSGDPRSIFISVNDGIAKELVCNSGNWSIVGVDSIELTLNAGNNILKFFNSTGFGPNIDKFELKFQSGSNPSFTFGSTGKINYNLEKGTASVLVNNKQIISDGYAEISNGTSIISSKQYASRVMSKTAINDGYGSGEKIVVTLSGNGLPVMEQIFYTYTNKEYFLTELVLKGANVQSNYMAPMISTNVRIYSEGDNRMLFVPFDNDTFIRYNSKAAQSNTNNTSSEVSAFYENNSRNGLVVGSVEHAAWKTGVKTTGTGGALSELKVWGGYTAVDVTRDVIPHGTLTGTSVKSPKIFIGLYDDWRQGMEDYGKANLIAEPTYLFDWDKPTPLGWNSWGVIQQNLTLENAKGVTDFVSTELPAFRNGDTAFINLDSYWDNLVTGGLEGNYSKLTEFVQHCKSKGLKPGIYWAPFMDFGKFDRRVEGSSFNYINAWTRVNGGYHDLDGGRALDPTHPATKERINLVIDKFKASGFEMIKIDFIGHAAIEADSYFDPQIKTGMQAFHHGMKYVIDRLENKMLVYLAISPSLASGPYGHMRRIATDSFATIDETQYTLNSTTYGWWQNQIYDYLDADHLVFKNVTIGENRARLVSGLVTGTVTAGDDFSTTGTWSSVAKQLLQNKEILKIAADGKVFRPVEGNSTQDASEVFVKQVGSSYYVGILNYGSQKTFNISLQRLGIVNGNHSVKELFSSNQYFLVGNAITVTIGAKDTQFLKINTAGTFTYFADSDGDSYGAGIGIELSSLTAPSGYSLNSDDCDDTNAAINPNALEIFDTIDNDCDGSVDEGTSLPSSLSFCKGASVANAKGTTDLQLFTSTSPTAVALSGTTALSSKVYYATLNGSARTAVTVTVNNLPSTPASMTTTDALLCKHIGTTNEVTYSVPVPVLPAVAVASYSWSLPSGVNAIGATDSNSITVNFLGASSSTLAGGIGVISARAMSVDGCLSLPRALTLSSKLPTAPISLTMTSTNSNDHFNVPVPGTLPIQYTFSSLADLTKITKVGPYMGSSTMFTLTAPVAPTAASYEWTFPAGVNQLSGGTSNIITIDFAGVAPGIGSLPIVVKSVGGCGQSTARTLTLGRTVPAAPTALTLTNSSQPNLSSLSKITKVGPYTGTSIQFTLTASPFLTQGATSTSYAWILPAGVTCETANTPKTVYQNVNLGTAQFPNIVYTAFDAIETSTNVITVNFNGATGTGNLELKVFGLNGAGNSIARKLVLSRALPTNPTKLVLTDPAISTTVNPLANIVTRVGPYIGETTSLTLTATPFLTQGSEATSFTWKLPAGVNVTAGATLVSGTISTPTTWTGTATALTINFDGVGTGITTLPLSVQAVNGVGTSVLTRTLTAISAAPTTPGSITTPTLALPTYNPACPGTTSIVVQVPSVFGVDYTWTVGSGASITAGQGTNSITIDVEAVTTTTLAISVIGSNGTGSSSPKALTIKKVATCRIAPESATASKFSAKAYPNPSSSEFTIETSAKGAVSVKVYDMQGRLVEKADTNRVGSKLAAGTYNLIVNQGAKTKLVRVIKK